MNVKPKQSTTDNKKAVRPRLIFAKKIDSKAKRKLEAQKHSGTSAWFGLGMMGLIGWSIALPTILGAALGIWLDKHYKIQQSWTLALIVAGLTLGCFTAWNWLSKEDKAMSEINKEDNKKDNEEVNKEKKIIKNNRDKQ
jgi:ATP synthase protein I